MTHQALGLAARERRVASQQVKQGASQTVDIGASIDLMTINRLFGSQIIDGSDEIDTLFDG